MHLPGGGSGLKRRRKMAESGGGDAGVTGELWWTERVLSEVQAEHPGELVRFSSVRCQQDRVK